MALIKCTKCGQMVSDRAEKCPKCGYPVHLSMKQQEETKQSVEPHATTFNTPQEEVINDSPQPPQRSNKKGIIIAVIDDNLQYPQQARDIQGTVRVEFIIEKNGNVSDVKINKSLDETLDKEACRIVEATNGKWYPAQKDGKAVRMKYILPIRFAMQ